MAVIYTDIEELQEQVLDWARNAKKLGNKEDSAELINLFNVLQDAKHIQFNLERRMQKLGALKNIENAKRTQLRFAFQQEDPIPFEGLSYFAMDIIKLKYKALIKSINTTT